MVRHKKKRTKKLITHKKKKYEKDGLEIIGIHSSEYEFAKNEENIVKALRMYGLEDTITGFDSNNKTWEAYGNSYWPKHMLIDKDGFVRYEHAGYGTPEEFEDALLDLLEIPRKAIAANDTESTAQSDLKEMTSQDKNNYDDRSQIPNEQNKITRMYGMHFPGMAPEICVGYTRLRRFGNNQKARVEEYNIFNEVPQVMDNIVYLKGKWFWGKEGISASLDHKEKNPSIIFKYNSASNVNIITGSTDGKPAKAELMLDGKYLEENQIGYHSKLVDGISSVDITWPFLMNVVKTKDREIHKLEILPKTDNFYFYTFVFG